MAKLALVIVAAVALSGCGTTKYITVEKPVIQKVEVPAVCPSKEERERLRKLKPTPLRDQQMPTSAVERNAQAQAQLGRYEAPGAYADQVEAALDRCQK